MLANHHFLHGILLIANLDLDRLGHRLSGLVDGEVDRLSFADDIEGVAEFDTDGFVSRGVIDQILADEFKGSILGITNSSEPSAASCL